jgi:hypothetical protein
MQQTDQHTRLSQPTEPPSPPVRSPLLFPPLLALPTCKQFPWRTKHAFCGNGSQKTASFHIGTHWRLVWRCEPGAVERPNYVVVLKADGPLGNSGDNGVQTVCEQHTTYGVDEIHSGGQVCLHIISGGEWMVQVQERQQTR